MAVIELSKTALMKVTFNNSCYGVGDEHEVTVDYLGDDIEELVAFVLASDPNFPMVFVLATEDNVHDGHDIDDVVGYFYDASEADDDRFPTAVMYR